jgi:cell division protein FtsQ
MRSVNVERKPRSNPRAKPARPVPPRGPRASKGVQPVSARTSEDRPSLLGLAFAPLARIFTRPMLALTAGLVILAALAAILAGGYVGRSVRGVHNAVSTTVADAGFGISEIHITGNGRVPAATILAALGMQPGQSIFAADLGSARLRLMALDWIASAEVVRRYPDAIFVTIVEKRPFALWQSPPDAGGQTNVAVVERSGGVITTRDVDKFSRLPKLVGAGAPQAAADLVDGVMAHRAIAARIAAYERVSERRWNLILSDGVVVKLPETDWAPQLDVLEHLIVDAGILERDVTEIDLRSPTQYFFVLKSGEKKTTDRGKDT